MEQQIDNVERMKRRRSATGGRLARQLEKTCESRKLSLIESNICNASSGVQAASGMDLRLVAIEPAQGAQCRTDLALDPAAHLGRGRSQLLQGKRKAGHHRLLVIGVRSS
jgi:hypothetical protein